MRVLSQVAESTLAEAERAAVAVATSAAASVVSAEEHREEIRIAGVRTDETVKTLREELLHVRAQVLTDTVRAVASRSCCSPTNLLPPYYLLAHSCTLPTYYSACWGRYTSPLYCVPSAYFSLFICRAILWSVRRKQWRRRSCS